MINRQVSVLTTKCDQEKKHRKKISWIISFVASLPIKKAIQAEKANISLIARKIPMDIQGRRKYSVVRFVSVVNMIKKKQHNSLLNHFL